MVTMVGNNQKCSLKVFTVRVTDAAGVWAGVESGWLPINYHFGRILLNLFSPNGSIKGFNFHGIIPCSSKGVDCAISHDFWSKSQGLPIFWGTETLFGTFWGIGSIKFDEIGTARKLLWNYVDSDYFQGFKKTLIFFVDFVCPRLYLTEAEAKHALSDNTPQLVWICVITHNLGWDYVCRDE